MRLQTLSLQITIGKYMPQVTIYLSEELLKQVKREAKRRQQSVSAYLSALASRAAHPPRLAGGLCQPPWVVSGPFGA